MADYFRRLASRTDPYHIAIIDPVSPQSPTPRQYNYAQLLSRVNVFHEILIAAAHEARKPLQGARIGLMVSPGLDFVAAVLAIWSVTAIVGMICRSLQRVVAK